MSPSLCLFELNLQGLWGRLRRGRRAAASAPAGPIQPGERRFGPFCPPLSASPLIGSVVPLRSAPFRLNADCARRVLFSYCTFYFTVHSLRSVRSQWRLRQTCAILHFTFTVQLPRRCWPSQVLSSRSCVFSQQHFSNNCVNQSFSVH